MIGKASARSRSSVCRRSVLLPALLGTLLVTATAPFAGSSEEPRPGPYVLLWPDSPENPRPRERRTEVGLVYSPEALRALVSRRSADTVPSRIADAIRAGTPIVVMWDFPEGPHHDAARPGRPYHVEINDRDRHMAWWQGVQPLWIQQDARELQQIDARAAAYPVGVMAAFPREAFLAGRLVCFHSHPMRTEHGSITRSQRWGAIE
jgi:hypothetical protein